MSLSQYEIAELNQKWITQLGINAALIARLERLESARIAAPVAPESAETAPGVPMEPGNATEAHGPRPIFAHHPDDPEVVAALRMYRKVQGVVPAERGSVVRPGPGFAAIGPLYDAATLLAWLKEGEA